MDFSRTLLKSLLEVSFFDKKLFLCVNKSWYCSLWRRPGFAQETLCSLERKKCYAEPWFTLITWLQWQDGKAFWVSTGQGHTLFCTVRAPWNSGLQQGQYSREVAFHWAVVPVLSVQKGKRYSKVGVTDCFIFRDTNSRILAFCWTISCQGFAMRGLQICSFE